MHKTILQMTGVDHSFDVLEKAFFAAIAQPSADELYLKLKTTQGGDRNNWRKIMSKKITLISLITAMLFSMTAQAESLTLVDGEEKVFISGGMLKGLVNDGSNFKSGIESSYVTSIEINNGEKTLNVGKIFVGFKVTNAKLTGDFYSMRVHSFGLNEADIDGQKLMLPIEKISDVTFLKDQDALFDFKNGLSKEGK